MLYNSASHKGGEIDKFLRNWILTLKSEINQVFAVFNWVFVTLILGNKTFCLYFLCNNNYFNWVFINSFAF